MKIIIVGCGKVGLTLTEQLNNEGHDITVIDKDGAKLRSVTDNIDVMGVEGNGAIYQVQIEAGIKETDLLIATTNSDELNMLCCLIAKKAGNCHTIARIRNPEYANEVQYIREELNLSMAINPELAAATEIARLLKFPSVIKIDAFAKGRVELMKFIIPDNSVLDNMQVYEVAPRLHCSILICAVERGADVIIPGGNFRLQKGDKISFVASSSQASEFFRQVGISNTTVKTAMLVGGGKITYYLAKMLYAGEDIKFIARRIMICASEDVGNADPQALQVAVAAAQAVERVGMPEAQIILSQAVLYVATAPKSNSACNAVFAAMDNVKKYKTTVPVHLQDAHYKGSAKLGHGIGYKYAHDYPNHYVKQQYLPDEIKDAVFYEASDNGYEQTIKAHMKRIKDEA